VSAVSKKLGLLTKATSADTVATAATTGAVFVLLNRAASSAIVIAIGTEIVFMATGTALYQRIIGAWGRPNIRASDIIISVAERAARVATVIARIVEPVFHVVKLIRRRRPRGYRVTSVTGDGGPIRDINAGIDVPVRLFRRGNIVVAMTTFTLTINA